MRMPLLRARIFATRMVGDHLGMPLDSGTKRQLVPVGITALPLQHPGHLRERGLALIKRLAPSCAYAQLSAHMSRILRMRLESPPVDFSHPSRAVAPNLDSEILVALAKTDEEFTGLAIARMVDRPARSVQGALDRLVDQGVVLMQRAGRAKLYSLNRDHLATPWIEGLAGLRQQFFDRVRKNISEWSLQPTAAAIFGSVARGDAGPESDIDLFLVRPSSADPDAWDEQVSVLTAAMTRWTGNDARELEFGEDELDSALGQEPVIKDVLDHGIEVGGSLRVVRKRVRG